MNENYSAYLTDTLAHLESHLSDATLPKDRVKKKDTRACIHVRSFRRLNGDPDGVSVKAAIDGIVERGILPDDSSKQISSVTFESITGCKEEQTIILITKEMNDDSSN
jgi:hypothetical protein